MSTKLQLKIYQFITAFIEEHGYSPSFEEIAVGIGISARSVSLISRGVHALVEEGKLIFYKKGHRNIKVSNPPIFSLPLLGVLTENRRNFRHFLYKASLSLSFLLLHLNRLQYHQKI